MTRHPLFWTIFLALTALSSCNQTSSKSSILDNLQQGDTLTLFAEFADCGEWGGHIEKIHLTNKGDELWVNFYKDTVSCDNDPNVNRKQIIERSQALKTRNRNKVVKYIDNFMIESKQKQDGFSHAGNSFKIITEDTTLTFFDPSMDWNQFTVLKDEILD